MHVVPKILTCGVGHNMAPHHNSVSTVSVWAPTGGSVNPLPLNWAEPSWSLPSHQKQVIWVERGRRGDGRDEGKRDDSQWHQGVSLLCSKQEAPLYSLPANSNHSGWGTARDWRGASIRSEPTDCLPGEKNDKFPSMFSSVKMQQVQYTKFLIHAWENCEIFTKTIFISSKWLKMLFCNSFTRYSSDRLTFESRVLSWHSVWNLLETFATFITRSDTGTWRRMHSRISSDKSDIPT